MMFYTFSRMTYFSIVKISRYQFQRVKSKYKYKHIILISHLKCGNKVVLHKNIVLLQSILLVTVLVNQLIQFGHVIVHITYTSFDVLDLVSLRGDLTWKRDMFSRFLFIDKIESV